MTSDNPNDLLGGGAYAKWGEIGVTYAGVVEKWYVDHANTDFDNNVKPCAVAELRQDDDEVVIVKIDKGTLKFAVGEAVKAAGVSEMEIGGRLVVKYNEDGEPSKAGYNPPKKFVAKYTPPTTSAGTAAADELVGL